MLKYLAQLNLTYPGPKPTDGGSDALNTALNITFGILGSISLIVIIISGIRLMTSGGNPDAIGKLRNTLIYAAIGLVVALTAAGILNLVLGRLG